MEGLVNLHQSYNLVDILDQRDYERIYEHFHSLFGLDHDASKCLEDNGKGLKPDYDCIDCSKPPKQACADGYIMSPSLTPSKRCTKITCKLPGIFSCCLF